VYVVVAVTAAAAALEQCPRCGAGPLVNAGEVTPVGRAAVAVGVDSS
jgi:hypothetical protein